MSLEAVSMSLTLVKNITWYSPMNYGDDFNAERKSLFPLLQKELRGGLFVSVTLMQELQL